MSTLKVNQIQNLNGNVLLSSSGSDANLTLSGELRGPATFIIDPATVGNDTGLVRIRGDLQVDGTTTTINSTTLTIDDKNIVLGDGATTDAAADGGGITLAGATSKTFNWVSATSAWTSSENLNLLSGKTYEINGVDVLTATSLGSGVVSSSLTSVGTLTSLTISGNLTVDTNTLFVDATNNRVGIGTVSPSNAFSIDGSSGLGALGSGAPVISLKNTDATNFNATQILSRDSAGNIGAGISFRNASHGATGSTEILFSTRNLGTVITPFSIGPNGVHVLNSAASTSPLQVQINAVEVFRVTNGGFVGIGTTSPGSILGTEENTTGSTEIRITNTNTANNVTKSSRLNFRLTDSVGTRKDAAYITTFPNNLDATTGAYLVFSTRTADAAPTEKVRIDNNGNVGISTTVPNTRLHVVNGDITVSNGGNAVDAGGAVLFGTTTLSTFSAMSSIQGLLINGIGSEQQGGIGFFTRNFSGTPGGGLTEKVRIQHNGNVGIGTTNPSSKLDVRTGKSATALYTEGRLNTISTLNWNYAGILIEREASNTNIAKLISFVLDGDSDADTNLYNYPNIVLRTSGTPTTASTSVALSARLEITSPAGVDLGVATKPILRTTSSGVQVDGSITESTDGGTTYWNVVTAQDIGTAPNQIPLNQYLGQLAFMDQIGDIPTSSSPPQSNLEVNFEYVSNTSIRIRMRGTDGVVRSTTLTLS